MGSFAPMLCLLTACHPAGARAFLHGSLVLGCPSVRVHDPRVVETGIEVSSLLSAFPGLPLPAANTAYFADTISVLGIGWSDPQGRVKSIIEPKQCG